jgi:hypothetical protein
MRRRAFTIAELLTSLAVTTVIVSALASCIALTARALPNASDPQQAAFRLNEVARRMADDVRFASDIKIPGPTEMQLQLADQDADGTPETIVYQWSGTAGTELTRTQNAMEPVPVHNSIDRMVIEWNTDAALSSAPSRSLCISLESGSAGVTLTQRCFNEETP